MEVLEGITPVARTSGSSAATGQDQSCKLSSPMTPTLVLYCTTVHTEDVYSGLLAPHVLEFSGRQQGRPTRASRMWGPQPYYLAIDYALYTLSSLIVPES